MQAALSRTKLYLLFLILMIIFDNLHMIDRKSKNICISYQKKRNINIKLLSLQLKSYS